jgi:hypothetical protein
VNYDIIWRTRAGRVRCAGNVIGMEETGNVIGMEETGNVIGMEETGNVIGMEETGNAYRVVAGRSGG